MFSTLSNNNNFNEHIKIGQLNQAMSDKSHMTPVQKVIAYSAILTGILAVLLAFGSSIHVAYHVFTSTGFTTTAVNIKGKERQLYEIM